MAITPGYDTALRAHGPHRAGVTVAIGTSGHGQGTGRRSRRSPPTSSASTPGASRCIQGDTDATPYGWGTFASRSMVVGGGATRRAAAALAERIKRHRPPTCWRRPPRTSSCATAPSSCAARPQRAIPLEDIARAAHLEIQRLPEDVEPGLEMPTPASTRRGRSPTPCHGAVVEIDPETGARRASSATSWSRTAA